ncbi:hypothetical protein CXB51_020738 [Gossypium anomalum]|uniref:Uncharacterized protein n=1 Tax=Gossypium anomalum TaxID=47600 RepID=A0A8J6CYL9_9ROSI|nr:hypothetical protein CXB51_020738 [Gossypium anomalum]
MENMELHQSKKVLEGEDRRDETSRLNDDILIRILGFLSFKEAVRAALFHADGNIFGSCLRFEQTKPRLASWNLNVRTRKKIAERFQAFVDEWVGIALQKKTKKLQLNFGPESYVRWSGVGASRVAARCYCLTKETFFSALSGIHFLTCLSVKFVGVSDEMLEQIVSICPLLESLELDHSPQLTHPKYAPKLNQVCYDDGSSSVIQHLSIHLANYLPQLVTLSIGMSVVGVVSNFPKLTSLKHLRCDALESNGNSLRCLTSLIEATPFLHKFVLEVS